MIRAERERTDLPVRPDSRDGTGLQTMLEVRTEILCRAALRRQKGGR